MGSGCLYDVTLQNDGTQHPDWKAEGPVRHTVNTWARSEQGARENVRKGFRADLGWEIVEVKPDPADRPTQEDGDG